MRKTCDLVMKGGITSGIVYPGAVRELAKEYEFVNIGGTSAGAIAAALTAAAELRRKSGGGDAGFDRLAELPAFMAEKVDGRSRLLSLFAPAPATAPLFHAAIAFIETKGTKGAKTFALLRALVRGFPFYAGLVALLGIALMIVAALSANHIAIVAVLLALAAVTGIGAIVAAVVEALLSAARTLPQQNYGISTGLALTEWLSNEINAVAGVTNPVTFADLRVHGLNLETMTTNLTHGRPYRLPMHTQQFFFDEQEMRVLFPKEIVDWMIAHAQRSEALYILPSDDLPIVVATRISLSFPLLLGAVPLWSIDRGAAGEHTPERCWFSDGGITSNFPVHFFDAPLPTRPTFAINLAERTPRYHRDGERVYMPSDNRGGILERWTPFEDLGGFLGAIINTMQNWRDNMLLHIPGQRDRIAHVLLAPDEGGLNLTMEQQTIDDLAARGTEAGQLLRQRFRWDNHQWVRFLSFMMALEPALEQWEEAFPQGIDQLVGGTEELPSYRVTKKERAEMNRVALEFLQHVRKNFKSEVFRGPDNVPSKPPVLRAMPVE